MRVSFMIDVDEKETTLSKKEILDIGLEAIAEAYERLGIYYDIGYNPQLITNSQLS